MNLQWACRQKRAMTAWKAPLCESDNVQGMLTKAKTEGKLLRQRLGGS